MKKIIPVSNYTDKNLIVGPEGVGVYLSNDEEVLSGIATPGPPTLNSPLDDATGVSLTPVLDWTKGVLPDPDWYHLQVSLVSNFSTTVIDQNNIGQGQVPVTSDYTVSSPLAENTPHYWRVAGVGSISGQGNWSSTWDFTTSSYFSVNFTAGSDGTISGDLSQTVESGQDSSAVTAVPDSDFVFAYWSGDNTSSDNPLTLYDVTSNMSVTANFAFGYSYQWQKDGINISGANDATYIDSSVSLSDDGAVYTCILTDLSGNVSTTSDGAILNVAPAVEPPVFTRQPDGTSVTEDATATFTVAPAPPEGSLVVTAASFFFRMRNQ